jgi:hypothetical protein
MKQKLNNWLKKRWQQHFREMNNKQLFEIYSEKQNFNLEPQLYAGNLLFDRNYDLEKLLDAKRELIESLEEAFLQKYDVDPKVIKRKNTIYQLFWMLISAIMIWHSTIFIKNLEFHLLGIRLGQVETIGIMAIVSFGPLLWLRKRNRQAINNVRIKEKEKNYIIERIKKELNF